MPSSVIARSHYDSDSHILTVVFISGVVYEYLKVPPQTYEAFKNSGSKGVYLNKFIKGHYDFRKAT